MTSATSRTGEPIRLYDGPAPGSESWTHEEREYYSPAFQTDVVTNVVVPTLTPVLPRTGTGTAVIVAPGGGYHALSINSEGFDVARWLAERGVAGFVLKYRLGFMGFSAGGNVTMRVAATSDGRARPDFLAPIYAAVSDDELAEPGAGSGPMFVVAATDDHLGLAADSIRIYERWRAAGLPVELHMYARGGHGFGMRRQGLASDSWIERFGEWLADCGLTAR